LGKTYFYKIFAIFWTFEVASTLLNLNGVAKDENAQWLKSLIYLCDKPQLVRLKASLKVLGLIILKIEMVAEFKMAA
jgi:hypothetical protein